MINQCFDQYFADRAADQRGFAIFLCREEFMRSMESLFADLGRSQSPINGRGVLRSQDRTKHRTVYNEYGCEKINLQLV